MMTVMNLRLDEAMNRALAELAARQEKEIDALVAEILREYLNRVATETNEERKNTAAMMKLSEPAFQEWDNPDDAIYDTL
jgi:hypothetical protein